jgi:hypothetical protein
MQFRFDIFFLPSFIPVISLSLLNIFCVVLHMISYLSTLLHFSFLRSLPFLSTPFARQRFGCLSGPPGTFRTILLFSADTLSPAPFQADVFCLLLSPFLGNISLKRRASFLLLMKVFNLLDKGSWNYMAEISCFFEITFFRHCYCSLDATQ